MTAGTGEADAGTRKADVTGVVLAGGRSRRFDGGDKALATVAGDSILARVVDALGAVAAEVLVNCRRDQQANFATALEGSTVEPRFAIDDRPDEGPLVGLDTSMREVETPLVLVASCDLPGLDPELLTALLAELDRNPTDAHDRPDAAVPIDAECEPNPACAAYRTDALAAAVDRAIDGGDRSLKAALDELRVATVAIGALEVEPTVLADVDSRADLEAHRARLGRE
jgi:molybdopterin-guanine dinucleotide biosynthesis protein A